MHSSKFEEKRIKTVQLLTQLSPDFVQYCLHFILALSELCPYFVSTLFSFCPDFVLTLSLLCPHFVPTLFSFCPILIWSLSPFVHTLSSYCPDIVTTLFTLCPHIVPSVLRPYFVPTLSGLCPHFVLTLSSLCPNFVLSNNFYEFEYENVIFGMGKIYIEVINMSI